MLQAADENRIPFLASALTFDAILAAIPLFVLVLAGLSWAVGKTGGDPEQISHFIERFLPPHETDPGYDPFEAVEAFLAKLVVSARQLSIVAVPAFLWFSTRLFASVRTALNEIYDLSVRPVHRHFLLQFIFGKLRDLRMVVITVLLVLVNTFLAAAFTLLQARGQEWAPGFEFFFTTFGRLSSELLAFLFLVTLFFLVYHFASMRRPPLRATLIASLFSAVLFEAAKRGFGLYLRNTMYAQMSVDVNVGAAILFVLWMYYSALVFLLGGVVAETWELRYLQRKQRA